MILNSSAHLSFILISLCVGCQKTVFSGKTEMDT